MLVLDLLKRVRQVGPAQAHRMLSCADPTPTCTVGPVSSRQRWALNALLRLRAAQLAAGARRRTAA